MTDFTTGIVAGTTPFMALIIGLGAIRFWRYWQSWKRWRDRLP